MNFSGAPNSTSVVATVDYVGNTLMLIDQISRFYSLAMHLICFSMQMASPKTRTRTYLYLNHAIFTNGFFVLLFVIYIYQSVPNYADQSLNNILCEIASVFFIFAIYISSFSVLLIAIYRYLAVFKQNLFKKLNTSILYLTPPLLIVWIASLGLPLISKFSFQTTYAAVYCLDGNSSVYLNVIFYSMFNGFFSVLIPSAVILVIYVLILRKLISLKNKLKTDDSSTKNTEANSRKSLKKEERFANQFKIMGLSVVSRGIILTYFSLKTVIPNYFLMVYLRTILRSIVFMSFSMVPTISIYYHPFIIKILKKINSKIHTI
jgi:hypothetical protein